MAPGTSGVGRTVRVMRELIDEGSRDPSVITAARQVVMATPSRDQRAEVRALYQWVQDHVRYTADPVYAETMLDAPTMLEQIELEGRVAEDCDGMTVLLGAMLQAIGYPVDLVVESYRPDQLPSHVLLATEVHGDRLQLDPTIPHLPMGVPAGRPSRTYSEQELAMTSAPAKLGQIPPPPDTTDVLTNPDTGDAYYAPTPPPPDYVPVDSYEPPPVPPPLPEELQVGGGSAGLPEIMAGQSEDQWWQDALDGLGQVVDIASKTPWVQEYLIEAQAEAWAKARELGGQQGEDLLRAMYAATDIPYYEPPGPQPMPAPRNNDVPDEPAPKQEGMPGWGWGAIAGGAALLLGLLVVAAR